MSKQVRDSLKLLQDLYTHLDYCPFGWFESQLITSRSTTESHILEWVQKLFELRECVRLVLEEKAVGKDEVV